MINGLTSWMPHFRGLSIKAKLSAGFGASLALIFLIGALALVQLWGLNSLATRVTENWLPEMETLGQTRRAVDEHWLLLESRINATNFRQIAVEQASMSAVQTAVEQSARQFAAAADDLEETILIKQFGEVWSNYLRSVDSIIARLDSGDPDGARTEFKTNTSWLFAKVISTTDELISNSKTEGYGAVENVRSVYWISLLLTLTVLLVASLIVGGAIWWISSDVSRPILKISNAMRRLSVGDESVSISEGSDRDDEIGILVNAVSGYRESLMRVRHLAEEASTERDRLDTALANMSQGLCMFDRNGRLVIFNERFIEIYGLPAGKIVAGMTTREIMELSALSSKATDADPEATLRLRDTIVREGKSGIFVQRLTDMRSISISYRPRPQGGFVVTFEDITEQLRAEERIRHLAHFDALTDLPNRVTFYEAISSTLAHLRRVDSTAILSLDLDHFKSVNDTLGHPVGDGLLKEAAARMRSCVRGDDIVARLGGDEFAIIQVPAQDATNVTALATRLIEAVGAPYDIDGHQVVVGVSIGIAVAPIDGHEPDVLMKNADLALYRAKGDGGGAYRFFETEMDARMQARRTLELDLRKAVVNGEFELYYQPIVDVKTHQITSCEALVRWHHPERGIVAPMEFIPLAEETSLIVPIGEWVLRQACKEAAGWPAHVTIAVNLSPAQFKSHGLVQTVTSALADSRLPPGRLELEITELVLLQDNSGTFAILHELRDLGIRIAMDDFGTGYSSLGYLRSFPFNKIKIDKSFVQDLPLKEDSIAIIRAVVGLGSSMGITTTAEGVETKEQFVRLAAEGCNEVQGFLFSKPRPANEIIGLINKLTPQLADVA
jgi:diguanylate cyclase (GGDEF)-like protein/PAS domain S-box-containing protein